MAEEATSTSSTAPQTAPPNALDIAFRHFGAVAGGISLLSLAKDALSWQHDLATWIDAVRHFTRPIATFLFGWVPAIFHWPFPGWAKDYLTVGTVTAGATMRALSRSRPGALMRFVMTDVMLLSFDSIFVVMVYCLVAMVYCLIWPVAILAFLLSASGFMDDTRIKKGTPVFFSTFVYAALIIVVNYVLIFSGARTGD